MNSIVFTLVVFFASSQPQKNNPPAQRRDTLNGTQFSKNVGADAHIGPKPYGTSRYVE